MKESENVEKPQDHYNHDDSIQDGLNRPLHRDEAIDQPQQQPHYDKNHYHLKQRHERLTPFSPDKAPGDPKPRKNFNVRSGTSVAARRGREFRTSGGFGPKLQKSLLPLPACSNHGGIVEDKAGDICPVADTSQSQFLLHNRRSVLR
jgi:hypothetical protein